METQLSQLKEFHIKLNTTWNDSPTIIGDETRKLRARLMLEEVQEAVEAMEEGDIEHIAKELSDVLYATLGTIGAYGLADSMPEIFSEVHASNMSKDYSDNPDAKMKKGEGYKEADISSILNT